VEGISEGGLTGKDRVLGRGLCRVIGGARNVAEQQGNGAGQG
jgi:hypothetical protein